MVRLFGLNRWPCLQRHDLEYTPLVEVTRSPLEHALDWIHVDHPDGLFVHLNGHHSHTVSSDP